MNDQVSELAQRGKALPPQERSLLVDILLESLHEPPTSELEAAWEIEVECRLAEYDQGKVKVIPAEEVFAKAGRMAR